MCNITTGPISGGKSGVGAGHCERETSQVEYWLI